MNGAIVLVVKAIVSIIDQAIGSIAWSTAGTYGHVAWVSNVIGDED